MEILKRAKGESGEIVPVTESEKSIKDEVNLRTYKAGYTDRDGQQMIRKNTGAGKGDSPRPVDYKKIDETYKRLGLGQTKLNVWPRDKHGNLID